MVQFGPHALSQGANFNTSLNDTLARSRFESKEACAARAVSTKDVGFDRHSEWNHAGEPPHCRKFRQRPALVDRRKSVICCGAGQLILRESYTRKQAAAEAGARRHAEGFEFGCLLLIHQPFDHEVATSGLLTDHQAAVGSPAGFRRCSRRTRSTYGPQGNPRSEPTLAASPACRNRHDWPEAATERARRPSQGRGSSSRSRCTTRK